MKGMVPINPLQQQPILPTSKFKGPFLELASASAGRGDKLGVKDNDTKY